MLHKYDGLVTCLSALSLEYLVAFIATPNPKIQYSHVPFYVNLYRAGNIGPERKLNHWTLKSFHCSVTKHALTVMRLCLQCLEPTCDGYRLALPIFFALVALIS